MTSLGDILKSRIEEYNLTDGGFKKKGIDYNKRWNDAVGFFQIEINKEREKPLTFIAIRQKLVALREIDDLRWFYYHCKKYAQTKDKNGVQNTFSKCFFGALK